MSTENEIIEETEEFDILTLLDDDGVEHQFELADSAELNGKEYVALIPIYDNADELLEDSGELVIMAIEQDGDEEFLNPVEDDAEYAQIADIFTERLSSLFDFEEEPIE